MSTGKKGPIEVFARKILPHQMKERLAILIEIFT